MSMEDFILYDPETGAVVARGRVPAGKVGQQARPGCQPLPLPRAAMRGPIEDNLEIVRESLREQISRSAADAKDLRPADRLRLAIRAEARIDEATTLADLLKSGPGTGRNE